MLCIDVSFFQEGHHFILQYIGLIQRYHNQAKRFLLFSHAVAERFKMRQLLNAGTAPGGPEIDYIYRIILLLQPTL
ncbi:hypothetical protein D9M68_836360 [compost metagenome]